MKRETVKGETLRLNGDLWTVVDVAPAEPLAEMVANILEEEGFVVVVRGAARLGDVLTHLGGVSGETTLVLVPEAQAEAALALIAETVTDFEGDELEHFLAEVGTDMDADTNPEMGEDETDEIDETQSNKSQLNESGDDDLKR